MLIFDDAFEEGKSSTVEYEDINDRTDEPGIILRTVSYHYHFIL
jgi:hypothetical protein